MVFYLNEYVPDLRLKVTHAFSCEKDPDCIRFIRMCYGASVVIFKSIEDLVLACEVTEPGQPVYCDDVDGKRCLVPWVHICISGIYCGSFFKFECISLGLWTSHQTQSQRHWRGVGKLHLVCGVLSRGLFA